MIIVKKKKKKLPRDGKASYKWETTLFSEVSFLVLYSK